MRALFSQTDTVVCPVCVCSSRNCLFSVSVSPVCLLFFVCNDVVAGVSPWMFTDTCLLMHTAPTAILLPLHPGFLPPRQRTVTKLGLLRPSEEANKARCLHAIFKTQLARRGFLICPSALTETQTPSALTRVLQMNEDTRAASPPETQATAGETGYHLNSDQLTCRSKNLLYLR